MEVAIPTHRNPHGCRQLTQAEVARMLGVSRAAVQQTERRALSKLAQSDALASLACDLGIVPVPRLDRNRGRK